MKQAGIEHFLQLSPVMPVVTIEDAQIAPDLARAFVRGGIRVIEVTLRTPAALRAIEAIAREEPGISVGAGTVLSVADLRSAASAGAAFAISPGCTPTLLEAGRTASVPYLPAVATARRRVPVLQVLSGRRRGRHPHAQVIRGSVSGGAFLPDGRHHAEHCQIVSRAAQRVVRGRLLAQSGRCPGGARLAEDRGVGRGSRRLTQLAAEE
jgi:hypothetical protein